MLVMNYKKYLECINTLNKEELDDNYPQVNIIPDCGNVSIDTFINFVSKMDIEIRGAISVSHIFINDFEPLFMACKEEEYESRLAEFNEKAVQMEYVKLSISQVIADGTENGWYTTTQHYNYEGARNIDDPDYNDVEDMNDLDIAYVTELEVKKSYYRTSKLGVPEDMLIFDDLLENDKEKLEEIHDFVNGLNCADEFKSMSEDERVKELINQARYQLFANGKCDMVLQAWLTYALEITKYMGGGIEYIGWHYPSRDYMLFANELSSNTTFPCNWWNEYHYPEESKISSTFSDVIGYLSSW